MSGPPVSILVNTCRGARWIDEALASARAQTFADWELLVLDDASDDDTAERARAHAAADERLHVDVAPRRLGLGAARRAIIGRARGRWLAFLDQDDVWLPDKLERQMAVVAEEELRGGDLGLVYTRATAFDAAGHEVESDHHFEGRPLPEGDILGELAGKGCFVTMSSALLRRDPVLAAGIPDEVTTCVDYWLFVAVCRDHRARAVQSVGSRYRQHEDNLSQADRILAYEEILWVLEQVADRVDPVVLARRRRVYQSLIGLEEIVTGRGVVAGLARILGRGSPGYLLSRPFARGLRSWRRWRLVTSPGRGERDARALVLRGLGHLGLLNVADRALFGLRRLRSARANRRFRRVHPGVALPPAALYWEVFHDTDWNTYHASGRAHAELFWRWIREAWRDDGTAGSSATDGPADTDAGAAPGRSVAAAPGPGATSRPARVLEWGCGPGRIVRHMADVADAPALELLASDVDAAALAWCREHVPGVRFLDQGPLPPLPLPDASIDAVYGFSVLTHLPADVQRAWVGELFRVLRPGGVLVTTTHGDAHRRLLAPDEQAVYAEGRVAVPWAAPEGRKWCLSVDPPDWVAGTLLAAFYGVRRLPAPEALGTVHDVWVARRPVASSPRAPG